MADAQFASSEARTAPASPPSGVAASDTSDSRMRTLAGGGGFDAQRDRLAPLQRRGDGAPEAGADVHAAAAHGVSGAGGALPHAARIQNSFGAYDLSNVTAHTDSAAAEGSAAMGAEAFATGSDIAFAGAPDLHTAAHEAAHVVQQRAGVSLSGGVGRAGDSYEQHADKVADAVVAGESAEPLLAEMAGGGASEGVQRSASRRVEGARPPVQRTGPPTPPSGPSTSPTLSPWDSHVATLPDDLKVSCQAVTDAPTQQLLMPLPNAQKRTYFKLAAGKTFYLDSANASRRPSIDAMAATPAHLAFFETLVADAAAMNAWLGVTPNERTDLLKITDPNLRRQTMTDPDKLAKWNATRVASEPNLANNRNLAAALITPTGNGKTELEAICAGQAGENLRRIAADPGFRNAQTPVDFVSELRANVLADPSKPVFDHMKQLRKPPYTLAGIETPISDAAIPDLCKAIPIVNVILYNNPGVGLKDRIMTANTADPAYPTQSVTDPATGGTTSSPVAPPAAAYDALPRAERGRFIETYLRSGGAFAVTDVDALDAVPITGGGGIAYWTADATAPISLLKTYDLATLRQKLAVEETPEYNTGAVVVNLRKTITQTAAGLAPKVYRPTAIDGLGFTQFDLAPAGAFCGVTSGGMGEVMIPAVTFADAESITYVR